MRRRNPMQDAMQALAAALLLAALLVLHVLTSRAHAGEPSPGNPPPAAARPPASPGLAPGQVVNDARKQETECACALSGAYGACFTRAELVPLKNAAVIRLPSCREQLAAVTDLVAVQKKLTAAAEAQRDLYAAASKDRAAATVLTQQAADVKAPVELPWYRRFGTGVIVGALATTVLFVGVVYALLPARQSASSSAGLRLAPLVRW